MYAWSVMWFTFGYYVFLTVLAVLGYLTWRKAMLAQGTLKTTEMVCF
jgi:hypothetical protein